MNCTPKVRQQTFGVLFKLGAVSSCPISALESGRKNVCSLLDLDVQFCFSKSFGLCREAESPFSSFVCLDYGQVQIVESGTRGIGECDEAGGVAVVRGDDFAATRHGAGDGVFGGGHLVAVLVYKIYTHKDEMAVPSAPRSWWLQVP